MKKLSSFRGKTKNRPKKSLTWFFQAPLQLLYYCTKTVKCQNKQTNKFSGKSQNKNKTFDDRNLSSPMQVLIQKLHRRNLSPTTAARPYENRFLRHNLLLIYSKIAASATLVRLMMLLLTTVLTTEIKYITVQSIPWVSPTVISLFCSCNNTPFLKNWCAETKQKSTK